MSFPVLYFCQSLKVSFDTFRLNMLFQSCLLSSVPLVTLEVFVCICSTPNTYVFNTEQHTVFQGSKAQIL